MKRIKLTALVILTAAIYGVFLGSLLYRQVLPEKYFWDGNFIRILTCEAEFNPHETGSFGRVADFYRLIGMGCEPPDYIITIVQIVVVIVITIHVMYISAGLSRTILWRHLIAFAWMVVSSVYLGQYSKEFPTFLVAYLLLFLSGLRGGGFLSTALVLAYGLLFRKYWLLIAFIVQVLYMAQKRISISPRRLRYAAFIVLMVLLAYMSSTLYYIITGEYITNLRVELNSHREILNALSMKRNIIKNVSLHTDVMNWLYSWMTLLLPFPALASFTPQRIAFVFLYPITMASALRSYLANKQVLRSAFDRRLRFSSIFILSFTVVQAIFEPDYGSTMKHISAILPITIYLVMATAKR